MLDGIFLLLGLCGVVVFGRGAFNRTNSRVDDLMLVLSSFLVAKHFFGG